MEHRVKESSDELNPPILTTGVSIVRPSRQSSSSYLALAVASCGVGYFPIAPGTWGSAFGVALYLFWRWLAQRFFEANPQIPASAISSLWTSITLVLIFCITMAGIWAATRVEALKGRKDPGLVVIDEVAGQLITLLFLPVSGSSLGWAPVIVGFLLFRMFDIWKPYPVRRLETLESGLGIMADDVLAGLYAAILLSLFASIYLMF